MKKAYYVYSSIEKLGITGAAKALSVVLMFSFIFLGLSTESSAQSVNTNPNAVSVDHTVIKNTVVNEDKGSALQVIKAELQILNDQSAQVQASAREEIVHGAKLFFLRTLGQEIQGDKDVVSALISAHSSLAGYAEPYNNNPNSSGFIDVEGIVGLYAAKLQ